MPTNHKRSSGRGSADQEQTASNDQSVAAATDTPQAEAPAQTTQPQRREGDARKG